MPEIPTVGETVPGFESAQWYGVGAPTGTPAAIIAALNEEVSAALADSKIKARIEDLGGIPLSMSPEEFGNFLANVSNDLNPAATRCKHCGADIGRAATPQRAPN